MDISPLFAIDFYKADHRRQYPEGTEKVYSNFTPRSFKHTNLGSLYTDHRVVFFGLQYFIIDFLNEQWNTHFFSRPKEKVIAEYKMLMDNSLGPDAFPLDHIESLHDLGYLPIKIKAVREGTLVPIKCPMLTIENTHPEFFWLTNYLESILSTYLWKACTSATTAFNMKRLLSQAAINTGANEEFVPFQAHDFSFRGMASYQDACVSGAAHLLSFLGTDTVAAIKFLERYYQANPNVMNGASVPATEHSVMCMGTEHGEFKTFERLIKELYPSGIVSIVSDTWDYWQVLNEFLPALKNDIMDRDGKVVIRPDSGDPYQVICGTVDVIELSSGLDAESIKFEAGEILYQRAIEDAPHGECGDLAPRGCFRYFGKIYECTIEIEWNRYDKQYYYADGYSISNFVQVVLTPEEKGSIETLWDIFGGTVNEEGYKTLDSHIGLIYGDSISPELAERITNRLAEKGFASDCIVLGVGSFTYQYVTRDTYGFAVKATYGEVEGQAREIYKDPKTDDGTKKSLRGLVRVDRNIKGELEWSDQLTQPQADAPGNLLELVYEDGILRRQHNLEDIRSRISSELELVIHRPREDDESSAA